MRWSVGIDPGFTEAAVMLLQEDFEAGQELTPVEWSTFTCPKRGQPDVCRAVAMSDCIIGRIVAWVEEYGITELDLSIELPIYKRSSGPQTLIKQARLLEEIESGVFHVVSALLEECWLTEVSPSTSKSLAGCSQREKPTEQLPLSLEYKQSVSTSTLEAVADAWAHGLATWGVGGTCIALHTIKVPAVKNIENGEVS